MDDLQASLLKAETQLMAVGTLYEADLELQRVSPSLRGKIKSFLENEREALDLLAQRLVAADDVHTHYPMASQATGFDASIDKNMPGVRENRPDVATAVGRHQPFGVDALARLRDLLVDPKLQRLTPRTRPAPPEITAPTAPVEPATPSRPPPSGGTGGGLTGPLFINGVEYDPITLQPLNPLPQPRRETVYVAWQFEGSEAPALQTLEAIHLAVLAAIAEVSATATQGP